MPLENVDDFPEHPFEVRDDEEMAELIESIRDVGVVSPIIVRKKEGERYEIISGHRRKYACGKLGVDRIPVIIREISREEAVIAMVDSNLQREKILPSEKARAYKMKMEAMKRQGKRTDLTSSPMETKLRTDELIAKDAGESRNQIQRYIRLNELVPELLALVDEGKIGLRPAVELSYLREEEQRDLAETIDSEDCYPSHAQAIRMRQRSREGKLNMDDIFQMMREQKGNQKERVKIPMEKLEKYFPRGTPPSQVEETIIKALEMLYRYRKRKQRDER